MDEDLYYKASAMLVQYHDGQMDKIGQPYIMHPQRVAMTLWRWDEARGKPFNGKQNSTALLHDLFEDTHATPDIVCCDLPKDVIEAIVIVSRQKGESYKEFIHRIANSENLMAIRVKIADLTDNLDPLRAERLIAAKIETVEETAYRRRKYMKSLDFLKKRLVELEDEEEWPQ